MPTPRSSLSDLHGPSGLFADVTRWTVYTLFFLLPLFFLPWTNEVLEVNKQMLLVVFTVIATMSWLGQMVLSKKLFFRSGWLNLVPLLFVGSVLASSFLSFAGYQTWIGQSSQEYTSFLTIAMLVALFFVLANNFSETKGQRHILIAVLSSTVLSGLVTLLGIFGLFHLPFAFAASAGFNPVGTINGFLAYLTVMMFVGLAMWLVGQQGRFGVLPEGGNGLFVRSLIILLALETLILQIAVDFWFFWVLNIVGVLLLLAFGFLQGKEFPNPKRFALPLIVALLSIVFFFLPSPLNLNLPLVISPTFETSFNISKSALSQNTTRLMLGTGPGTFMHDYLAFKPASVNASQFWSLRFDRSKSHAITMLATIGIAGVALWLLFMSWLLIRSLAHLLRERDKEEWKMTYVVFVGWFLLFIIHLFYSSNMTLMFLLWGFSGLLASQVMVKLWTSDFRQAPRLGLLASFGFVLVGVGVLASLFVTGQRYAAEVSFAKAVTLDQNGASNTEIITELEKAIRFNGLSDRFYRNLSSAKLQQARSLVAQAAGAELTAEQTQQIGAIVGSAVTAATQATSIEPNYAPNWVVRGSIYRDLMSFAQGAEELAAQMFLTAIQIEPVNPSHRTNLGQVYLAVANRARALRGAEDEELANQATQREAALLQAAEEAFTSAVQLKQDYLPAHYYLASVYERQGRLTESAQRLLALRNNAPTDVGIAFQLSQMLIRLEEYDAAKGELERIVTLDPNYSNALWFLASMYEISGDSQKALDLVHRVVQNNPGNEAAQKRLERMERGEMTTVIPEPIIPKEVVVSPEEPGEVVQPEGDGQEVVAEESGEEAPGEE